MGAAREGTDVLAAVCRRRGMLSFRQRQKRWSVVFLISLLGVVSVFAFKAKYGQFHSSYASVVEQHSSDEEHKIIIYEYRGVFLDYGMIYEVCAPLFMKRLDTYWSESIMPAKSNAYQITWNDNNFIYDYQYSGISADKGDKMERLVIDYGIHKNP